jgi:transposase
VSRTTAGRLVAAARVALPTLGADVARQALATDMVLLAQLETQIAAVEERLAALLPSTEYAVLTSAPGWGVVRAAQYAGALGSPKRWPSAAQVYRASGLTPRQYESAGRRRDGGISREGSVTQTVAGTGELIPAPFANVSHAGQTARAEIHPPPGGWRCRDGNRARRSRGLDTGRVP